MLNARWNFLIGIIAGFGASGVTAQELPEPNVSPEQSASETETPIDDPIVVSGQASDIPKVVLGSRIPRVQRVDYGAIATNTGTRGLVPQSGMDQGASVRTIRTVNCVSDDNSLSKAAKCIMADAQSAYEAGRADEADEKFDVITDNGSFSPQDRLASARWQYRIADETEDLVRREYALIQMVWTGAMDAAQAASGHRTLVSWALKRGDRNLAQTRLSDLDSAGLANATDLANLAILSRELGETSIQQTDTQIMARAIAIAENAGNAVPQGWRDFVGAESNAAPAQ